MQQFCARQQNPQRKRAPDGVRANGLLLTSAQLYVESSRVESSRFRCGFCWRAKSFFHKYHMKTSARSLALLAAVTAATAPVLPVRANVLGDIQRSISSLWRQKSEQQTGARATLKQATAKKQRAEFIEERLEKTAVLLDRASENYRDYSAQLTQTETRIVATRHCVQIATARAKEHNRQFGLRLAALQQRGDSGMLSVILGSDSLAELSRRTSFMRTLNENDAQLQADLKADHLEVMRAQNLLMEQWQNRVRLARAAHLEQARIETSAQQQQLVWRQINASKVALLRIAAARQNASDSIGAQIQSLEARKTQLIAQYETGAASARTGARAHRRLNFASGVESYGENTGDDEHYFGETGDHSDWIRPASGRISSGFGMRYHPILHREKLHTGEDIAAVYGSPFRAARGGRVLYAGWQTAYGKTIIIDNGNGTTTLYGHASKLDVSAGQSVGQGQQIGNVGSTGWSTGPHLHFEVRKNGVPIDPSQCVR